MKKIKKRTSVNQYHRRITARETKYVGAATIGERGQVVIPAAVRKKLQLKAGDKMVVFIYHGKLLGMLKAEVLRSLIDTITKEFKRAKNLTAK